jgi:hypothetical protein
MRISIKSYADFRGLLAKPPVAFNLLVSPQARGYQLVLLVNSKIDFTDIIVLGEHEGATSLVLPRTDTTG